MKTPLRLATALAAVFLLTSCSAPVADTTVDSTSAPTEQVEEVEEAPEPVDLTGEWKQTNSGAEDSFQSATITGQTIEVFWNSPDMQAIYWAGNVEIPADGSTSFTWDSVNDTTKTDNALMASSDDTKTFTYADGELSYELTALGTTMTVRLAKQ
ncbi:hypothetical protein [Microbacterium sp. NPDC097977]|uniref:hypothetical protein n=1 Tax=Microbacterium sp. NPDC097977 TaxID=3155686 RepID=UPI0033324A95